MFLAVEVDGHEPNIAVLDVMGDAHRGPRPRRSCLAVPGSSTKMLGKAQGLPADQVFLDLEDAVAPGAKEEARANIVSVLNEGDWSGKTRVVRVNDLTTKWTYRDVITVVEGANTSQESVRGQLSMVTFAQPQQLQKDGLNTYLDPTGTNATPATNVKLIQGYLEKSNVNGVVEMSRLIEITRSYAEVANLLQQEGDLHKNAIQQLSEIPS